MGRGSMQTLGLPCNKTHFLHYSYPYTMPPGTERGWRDGALLPEATAWRSTRKFSELQVEVGARPHRGWPGAKKNATAQPQTHSQESGRAGGAWCPASLKRNLAEQGKPTASSLPILLMAVTSILKERRIWNKQASKPCLRAESSQIHICQQDF